MILAQSEMVVEKFLIRGERVYIFLKPMINHDQLGNFLLTTKMIQTNNPSDLTAERLGPKLDINLDKFKNISCLCATIKKEAEPVESFFLYKMCNNTLFKVPFIGEARKKLYFYNEQMVNDSQVMWDEGRFIDLETRAYAFYQLSKYFSTPRYVPVFASVAFSYQAIDMISIEKANSAYNLLINNYKYINELSLGKNVRENRHHLDFSMLCAKWHLELYLNKHEELITTLRHIFKKSLFFDTTSMKRISAVNVIKSLMFYGYILYYLNLKKHSVTVLKSCLTIYKSSINNFSTNSDIVHFKESEISQRDTAIALAFYAYINSDKTELHDSLKFHFWVSGIGELLSKYETYFLRSRDGLTNMLNQLHIFRDKLQSQNIDPCILSTISADFDFLF
ncbi:hypothetical protein [Solidesulfovibrio alcoholivorans]|uniref:hypothetical protein n=1 Tax=Solidesulfovibrio alcoholivorans TaxID=81406 RepID=UPI0012EB46F3|nr:hypothetical protein [Solidesulfovibrio alcoholivorans]